ERDVGIDRLAMSAVEVVEHHHLFAVRAEPLDGHTPDVTRAAGDEHCHMNPFDIADDAVPPRGTTGPFRSCDFSERPAAGTQRCAWPRGGKSYHPQACV